MNGLKKIIGLAILTIFLGLSVDVSAQPDPSPSAPGDPGDDPDAVPIGGIEVLLVAGGALGIRKLIKDKDKK